MEYKQPLSQKTITRLLVFSLVVVSLLFGYYHASLTNERKKYLKLEDMYVRIRSQLGREETQRLIDQSREQERTQTLYDW